MIELLENPQQLTDDKWIPTPIAYNKLAEAINRQEEAIKQLAKYIKVDQAIDTILGEKRDEQSR